jgi:DNA mismatch endonuclease, patch repair protein
MSGASTPTPRPSYKGRHPASKRASNAARGSSRKTDTRCEVTLRRALWATGCRYRKNVSTLPGKPDIVFPGPRVAVFCDGDFWHGRDWESRRQKLCRGTNSVYWLAKIQRNIERDHQNSEFLQEMGWTVLRFWESEIRSDTQGVAFAVLERLGKAPC